MSLFINRLSSIIRSHQSMVCVGLDPDPARFPDGVKTEKNAVFAFNRAIIDRTADLVCAYKLNLAFYEVQGPAGLEAMEKTIRHIPEGVIVIGDAKRGDIDNTARMYAQALFEYYGFNAVTVNPYLGRDSVQPFLDYADRGSFILCRTSNPGAGEFQDIPVNGDGPLYMKVAQAVGAWNTGGNAGLVVGATGAASLSDLRKAVPHMPFLVPGVGAQGGDLSTVVRSGVNADGEGLVINASRSVLYASSGSDFAEAARQATQRLRDEINRLTGR